MNVDRSLVSTFTVVYLAAAAVWAICDAVELHMPTVDLKRLVSQIAEYIGRRTPVEFTHAICPDCAARLYPELSREKRQES